VSRPAIQPIVTTRSSAGTDPPDAAVAAVALECSTVRKHRAIRDEIEDEVIALVGTGEVGALVVDHLVRAERPHEVKLAAVVDSSYVRI
jgi:hypothetical protein